MRTAPLFACLGLLSFATPAAADRFALEYSGMALGVIPIGRITLDADVSEASYDIAATLRSGGLATLFEPTTITASASGVVIGEAVRWRRYDLDHHYSKKHRVVRMSADEAGAISAEITPNYRLWGDPPASDTQRARARDPLSTLMAMAVDVGATRRCAGAYPTFDGRFYYILELSGGDIDRYRAGGYDGAALKCVMGYFAVAGFERGDAGKRRIPHGEVWFALEDDSRFAPPVRITTPLAAGGAVIRLTQWRRALVNVAPEHTAR